MGGRFYIQQFITAIFPFLMAAIPLSERVIARLFYLQCLLVTSFLISEFALSTPYIPLWILNFFEVTTDTINFELQASSFGIRRFQSLGWLCAGAIYFMWARFGLKRFLSSRGLVLIPFATALVGLGMMSGHRFLLITLLLVGAFCAYAQRVHTVANVLKVAALAGIVIPLLYGFTDRLPLAAQRAVSFLPGIQVHSAAARDAEGTWMMRRNLASIGLEMVPQYVWLGRGLGFAASGAISGSSRNDPISYHVSMGRFYNGIIGLLVNTGIFGTVFMGMFLIGGTLAAWDVIKMVRATVYQDRFALVSSVIASLWIARVVTWVTLHGDSEVALKSFSLQAAMIIVCRYRLSMRLEVESRLASIPA